MPTYTALTTLTGRAPAEALAEAMEDLTPEPTGVGMLEVGDDSGVFEIGGYFTESPDHVALALLAAAWGARPFTISELPETDWVAHVRRELAPVIAGRFFVYGSHDADKVPEGVVPLAIDAAMAFGTGHHGTTQGCLVALDRLASNGFTGTRVADIGCGTAVLAMAAALIWPEAQVLAGDIDEVAVETAVANLGFNSIEGRVACVTCAGFDHTALAAAAPFDLIFANILKGPLLDLVADMRSHAATGGYLILSGILNDQAGDVIDAYQRAGFHLITQDKLGEWSTLTLQKSGH